MQQWKQITASGMHSWLFLLATWHYIVFQISELYGMVKKWEATADVLPHVVDRLSALKDLHEQGNIVGSVMHTIS